jgi:hemolysin III
MILLYLASTLYHALPRGRAKDVFRVLEHSGIFLLIAGSYAPFTLGVLRGPWGWTILGLVSSLAVLGIVLTVVGGVRHPILSTSVYVAMGWLVLVGVRPLWLRMPGAGFVWLVAGGIAYDRQGQPPGGAPRGSPANPKDGAQSVGRGRGNRPGRSEREGCRRFALQPR